MSLQSGDAALAIPHDGADVLVRPQGPRQTGILGGKIFDNLELSISSSFLFQVLHDLVNVIVLILLEPGVAELPEGSQLVRALNVLTVKIVDR